MNWKIAWGRRMQNNWASSKIQNGVGLKSHRWIHLRIPWRLLRENRLSGCHSSLTCLVFLLFARVVKGQHYTRDWNYSFKFTGRLLDYIIVSVLEKVRGHFGYILVLCIFFCHFKICPVILFPFDPFPLILVCILMFFMKFNKRTEFCIFLPFYFSDAVFFNLGFSGVVGTTIPRISIPNIPTGPKVEEG